MENLLLDNYLVNYEIGLEIVCKEEKDSREGLAFEMSCTLKPPFCYSNLCYYHFIIIQNVNSGLNLKLILLYCFYFLIFLLLFFKLNMDLNY